MLGSARALADSLSERSQRLLEVARSSPAGGGADWDALLRSFSLAPLTAEERAQYRAAGPEMKAGAIPLEVRRALERLERQLRGELAQVDRDDPDRDALERELSGFVDRALRAYIAAVRPPAPTSRIFQNAARTTSRYQATSAGVSTVKCTMCGAARADAAVSVCQFCGTPLHPSETT